MTANDTVPAGAAAPAAAAPDAAPAAGRDQTGDLLRVRDVHKAFGGFEAVGGVSFEVHPGEILGLIGPNGAGKSTLFDVVSGFQRATSGTIAFDGRELQNRPAYMAARLGLARTFQITRVFKRMTVRENVAVAALDHPGERLWDVFLRQGSVRRYEAGIQEKVDAALDYFKLTHLRDNFAGTLSGGQRKLLELARAFVTDPKMLMLDEPMAGVNPALKEELLGYILDLRGRGITFLVIEHDMDMIMRICDRLIVMAGGIVIAAGPPQEVRRDAGVIEAYLGGA